MSRRISGGVVSFVRNSQLVCYHDEQARRCHGPMRVIALIAAKRLSCHDGDSLRLSLPPKVCGSGDRHTTWSGLFERVATPSRWREGRERKRPGRVFHAARFEGAVQPQRPSPAVTGRLSRRESDSCSKTLKKARLKDCSINYCRSETRQEFRPSAIPKVLATFATSKSDTYFSNDTYFVSGITFGRHTRQSGT